MYSGGQVKPAGYGAATSHALSTRRGTAVREPNVGPPRPSLKGFFKFCINDFNSNIVTAPGKLASSMWRTSRLSYLPETIDAIDMTYDARVSSGDSRLSAGWDALCAGAQSYFGF